eukprot:2026346-Rhodomonas_salina.3
MAAKAWSRQSQFQVAIASVSSRYRMANVRRMLPRQDNRSHQEAQTAAHCLRCSCDIGLEANLWLRRTI